MESTIKILNLQIDNYYKEYLELKKLLSDKLLNVQQKDKKMDYSNINIEGKNLSISFIFFLI